MSRYPSVQRVCRLILLTVLPAILIPAAVTADEPGHPDLLLVVGAPGLDEYRAAFAEWADRWMTAATAAEVELQVIGVKPHQPTEDSENEPLQESAETDRDQLLRALHEQVLSGSTEPLWLVFIGHGTWDQKTARLNLQGPDISAAEISAVLQDSGRPIVAIFCCSSSAPFLNALSAPGRVIITATRDGAESQYSRFGAALSTAVTSREADRDQDGQVSLLEAWLYASIRTAEFYEQEGRLATEHSLLDDNGDQRGIRAESVSSMTAEDREFADPSIDGELAASISFVRSEAERRMTADQRLLRDALEVQLRALKVRRRDMDETDYLQRLEDLLVPLAKLYEESAAP